MRRERPHPLTHRASRLLWGRSRLSHAQRVTHLAASQSRSCKTTSITPRKGESKDKDQSPRNTTQDGNLPRFMMSRASKASWTGMLNSVMILVFLTVAIWFGSFVGERPMQMASDDRRRLWSARLANCRLSPTLGVRCKPCVLM